ncbi:MAG: hypothetical protein L0241_10155 [Planctomycetia bacterium]|nr:hypothetical protein [Planctomycetia bacterium]
MSVFISGRAAVGLLLFPLAVLFTACDQRPAATDPTPVQIVQPGPTGPVSTEPGEIELSDPQVTFTEPNQVRFEVRYRFTKGKPDKYYMCEVSFPGTMNHGAKPMESWELKSEGVIKDGITLSKPPVQTFEIRVSEADSPQKGYKTISNVVSGPVK